MDLIRLGLASSRLTVTGAIPALAPTAGPRGTAELSVATTEPFDVTVWRPSVGAYELLAGEAIEPVLFEDGVYDIYLESFVEERLVADPPSGLAVIRGFGQEPRTTAYRLRLGSDVGLLKLVLLTSDGKTRATATLEVFPRKLDYQSDYRDMVADLANLANGLLFASQGRTAMRVGAASAALVTTSEWLTILDAHLDGLVSTVDALARSPRRRLRPSTRWEPASRVGKIDAVSMRDAWRTAGNVTRPLAGPAVKTSHGDVWPLRLPQRDETSDFDTEENRYLRWLLTDIRARLMRVRHALGVELTSASKATDAWRRTAEKWHNSADHWLDAVDQRLNLDFLAEVGPYRAQGSPVAFQTHPLYSRIHAIGQTLRKGLSTEALPTLDIATRPVWLIYEYWCFLALADLLAAHLTLEETSAVQTDFNGSRLALAKGERAAMKYRAPDGRSVALSYNQHFSTPTLGQQPDLTLALEGASHIDIFDAKYRLQYDADYVSAFGGPGPTAADVNIMHRYRDAIVVETDDGAQRAVRSACVLFPAMTTTYDKHRFHKSLTTSRVGGLPFLPGQRSYLAGHVGALLAEDQLV